MSGTAYVDASALVKLVLDEPDSPAMFRWYVESRRIATSRIGVIETRRAAARGVHDPDRLRVILATVDVIEVLESIVERASSVAPPALRTLDAIHLATALALVPDLDAFVTYDDRLADAARSLGLPVVRPA
jgi:predicted nucleic acid-binding protein